MNDIIVAGIIIAVVLLAVMYLNKAKKSGVKCVGCPAAHGCSAGCKENNKK